MCLGRKGPEYLVAVGDEEDRDGQPRWPRRFHNYLERRPRRRPLQSGRFKCPQALGRRDGFAFGHHFPVTTEHSRSAAPPAMPRSKPMIRRSSISNLLCRLPVPADRGGRHHLATVPRWLPGGGPHSCAANDSGLTGRVTSLIRVIRGQAKKVAITPARRRDRPCPQSQSSPPPGQPGCLRPNLGTAVQWWIHRPESLT